MYFYHSSIRARPRRSNASVIMRQLEEVSLQPVHPPGPPPLMEEVDPPGLPSYEQALAKSGQHDLPPPPYPGYFHFAWPCTFVFTVMLQYDSLSRLLMHTHNQSIHPYNIFSYFWF